MSFELLDSILVENGREPILADNVKTDSTSEVISEDAEIFSKVDSLIEEAMRASLRSTIVESAINSDTKIDHLTLVEDAVFTKEQMESFMETTIHPILELGGYINGITDLGGKDPVAVSLPVYETALTIYEEAYGWADPDVTSDEESLEESLEESVIENSRSLYQSILSESESVDTDESGEEGDEAGTGDAVDEDDDLTADGNGPTQSDSILKDSFINKLADIFETYGISDDDEDAQNYILDEAIDHLVAYGLDNLRPSISDLAEVVVVSNMISERDGTPTISQILESELHEVNPVDLGTKSNQKLLGAKPGRVTAAKNYIGDKMKNASIHAKTIGTKLSGAANSAKDAVKNSAKKLHGYLKGSTEAQKKAANAPKKGIISKSAELARKGYTAVSKGLGSAKDAVKNASTAAGKAISDRASKIGPYIAKHKMGVGVGATAVAAATGAALAYKRHQAKGKTKQESAVVARKLVEAQLAPGQLIRSEEKSNSLMLSQIADWKRREVEYTNS